MKLRFDLAAFVSGCVLCSLFFSGCGKNTPLVKQDALLSTYDTEPDWNDNTKLVKLGYQEAQGKRVFYQYCVWCHADATPAGPSNRSNVTPVPPLMSDGGTLNGLSDEFLQDIITKGGSALGKSAMMPPYGDTLRPDDIKAVIAFARTIASPAYQKAGPSSSQPTTK